MTYPSSSSASSYDELTREGLEHAQNDRPLDAKSCFERAIELNPNTASVYSNLGIVLSTLGENDAAIAAFERAIALQPGYKNAYLNLALTQQELGKNGSAADNFLKVIALDSSSFQAYFMLSIAYFQLQKYHLANDAVDQALALQPNHTQVLHNKSSILTMLGRLDEVIEVNKQILVLDPTSRSAYFHLAKHGHADVPDTAPASYVTDLFDQYAATFDVQLLDQLGYCTPEHIGTIVRKLCLTASTVHALDLGCGTGLVAAQLTGTAIDWTGIDLSQKMLAEAAKKSLYTELHCTSIEDYLTTSMKLFDLIVSADVFVYVGELAATFKLVSEHLADNGWFIFSVEQSEQQPLALRPSGRYAHSQAYLAGLAVQCGLTVQTVDPLTLRFDGNTPIEGLVVALQKLS